MQPATRDSTLGKTGLPSSASNETGQIRSLTSLRWFSALYVYLFHIAIRADDIPDWLSPIIDNGYVGMSFFFILSGFVLAISNYGRPILLSSFILNRISRIYPAYIGAVWYTSPSLASVLGSAIFSVNALCNIFILQAWMPNLFPLGINGGMWSLSVELFFYVSFPFLLPHIVSVSMRARASVMMLVLLWLASFVPGFVEYLLPSNRAGLLYYYSSPMYRLPEFVIGMLLGVLWRQSKIWRVHLAVVVVLGAAYFYSCFLYNGMARQNQTFLNMTAVPFIGCLLVYAAQSRPRVLEWKPLVYLGEISYGFYVFQFIFFTMMYKSILAATGSVPLVTVYGIITTSAIASVSFHFFERPLRFAIRWTWRKLHPTRSEGLLKPLAVSALGVVPAPLQSTHR